MQQDTIFALSTPPGKSGVAIIRISGAQSADLLISLTKRPTLPTARHAVLSTLFDRFGNVLDKALILYFKAPHSFTGEDAVELHTHGGSAILRSVMAELASYNGVRPAEPGEFMRRAFLNEKVDLLEVEAIADMIDADTAMQLKQANKQMQGDHSAFYQQLRMSIVEILSLLEAYIDFPEEDIPPSILSQVIEDIQSLKQIIAYQLDDNRAAERLRSGFHIAIIGAPNVGKSTLLNALAGREAAIVTPHAGTTRDVIALHMDIKGYPVILSDTAGIRESEDEVEQMGVERSKKSIGLADMLLLMVDATQFEETYQTAMSVLEESQSTCPSILWVINKVDMVSKSDIDKMRQQLLSIYPNFSTVATAVNKSNGLNELEDYVQRELSGMMPAEDSWITRSRHRELLGLALNHLSVSYDQLPLELYAEEIRLAAVSIGKITGTIIADELLEQIFSRFCIGK